MIPNIFKNYKEIIVETIHKLTGSDKRIALAKTVEAVGKGGKPLVANTLILNADNGPENHSRRTQFMKRMIEFAVNYDVKVLLAYYPSYHSKYNPIERVWGRLEQHWNGAILDTMEAVVGFAESMTWKGENPCVSLCKERLLKQGKRSKKRSWPNMKRSLSEQRELKSGLSKSALINVRASCSGNKRIPHREEPNVKMPK
ncbi:ISAzo13-like element transposase-related protein [Shouchella shacheensis]|uniref:ISAzo13-like element transposase-related protein n=1 Tax=Shouchella shacheensis TaxID=1649580 RepID=UPI00074031B5